MSTHGRFSLVRPAVILLAALPCIPAAAGNLQDPNLVSFAGAGDLDAVKALVQTGADVNYSRGDTGTTALMSAAAAGHVEIVRALLADGAKVNTRDKGGSTALLQAVTGGKLEVVKVLIAARADPDICASSYAQCRGPLMAALANSNLEMARVLLEGGADVNTTTSYGATPLRFAVWGDNPGQVAMVKALLARGADVDAGYAPQYKVTVKPGAMVAGDSTGEVDIRGIAADRNAEGTALGDIAAKKSAELVKVFLDAGAKVDARQRGWRTPLMLASISGNLPVVRLLLDAGADVHAKDSNDRTALDLAVANGRQDAAQLLRNVATVRTPQ